ncbi:hypothetical protein [Anaerotruncus colihominis]|jgi:hypothetical protein|nr:hypothetical protein [Anaerotruncus colihominis]
MDCFNAVHPFVQSHTNILSILSQKYEQIMYAHNISDCCISREKGMLKNFSRLRAGLFEKRPRRKTLVGCAANSGVGSDIYTGCAANSGAGSDIYTGCAANSGAGSDIYTGCAANSGAAAA